MNKAIKIASLLLSIAAFTACSAAQTNSENTTAREVMTELLGIMKSMRFQCVSIPSFITSTNDTHRMTARFSRIIGVNDALK